MVQFAYVAKIPEHGSQDSDNTYTWGLFNSAVDVFVDDLVWYNVNKRIFQTLARREEHKIKAT